MAEQLTKRRARLLADRIKRTIAQFEEDITEFVEGGGWVPLGYVTLAEWWDTEIGEVNLRAAMKRYVFGAMVASQAMGPGHMTLGGDTRNPRARKPGQYKRSEMASLVGYGPKSSAGNLSAERPNRTVHVSNVVFVRMSVYARTHRVSLRRIADDAIIAFLDARKALRR